MLIGPYPCHLLHNFFGIGDWFLGGVLHDWGASEARWGRECVSL